MNSLSVSVDVPSLADKVWLYTNAFGFSKIAELVPGVAELRAETSEIFLLEKGPGSILSVYTEEKRHYQHHWMPVHMDFLVDDLNLALAKALEASAKQEQRFENPEHSSVTMCSDLFGHVFCVI